MAPARILLIRHAEKPQKGDNAQGVTHNGVPDAESLTPRGGQRAGALVRFFCPLADGLRQDWPSTIFAAGTGPGSPSRRPKQTIAPLAAFLAERAPLITTHLKDDVDSLAQDVLSRDGVVLVSWEHKSIHALLKQIPHEPPAPDWPDERFDVVFVLEREGATWRFSQRVQQLLAGDGDEPVA